MTDDNRQSDKIIEQAEIYKVEFTVGSRNYIYVGLDTKCDPNYFGSSLVIYHYEKVFGDSLFQKEILEELSKIAYTDLCSIEQKYIRESKEYAKKNNCHSINYTGKNRRESGPKIDVPVFGEQIINEAKLIGLELRFVGRSGIMKPTFPPPPFDKASGGGMHIETAYGLKRIGFAFYGKHGSDHNIGLATAILRGLEFDDDSISTMGPADFSDYQYVLAIHNSRDPKHLADLFKRLVDMVKLQTTPFLRESSDDNVPIDESEKIQEAKVTLSSGNYTIKRYRKGYIRILKEGDDYNPIANSKAVLREVNRDYNLGLGKEFFSQTQRAGKKILDELN